MRLQRPGIVTAHDEAAAAVMHGLAEASAALCLCDDRDLIRYANPAFRHAFFPHFDGRPADFMETITAAMTAGTSIRLVSATMDDFAHRVRQDRHRLVGSRSFTTDTVDGRWWNVTDTKLSTGWMLAIAQDISALKSEEAKLRDAHDTALAEAQTDYLTGAPNRRHGLRRAEALWKAARRTGLALSLALLDIDHFKAINDVYGHEAGDRALVHLTDSLTAALGPEDQFSRLGGDEFMLVSAGAGAGDLQGRLSAILGSLASFTIHGTPERLRLSLSVGIAEARPDDTWPGLMHRADLALYDAKSGGRDRIARAG